MPKTRKPNQTPGVSVTCPSQSGPCPACTGLSVKLTRPLPKHDETTS